MASLDANYHKKKNAEYHPQQGVQLLKAWELTSDVSVVSLKKKSRF